MSTPTHCPRCSTPFSGTVPMEKGKPVCPTCREPLPPTEERAASGELAPGTMLGQYQILEVVGRGGMGLVYTAIQLSLHRKVAVKTLAHDRANAESFRRRFERESLALAAMDHPNIVRVIDRGSHEEIPYFVMDFVDGMDLRAYMQGRRLPLAEVVRIVGAVCDGLDYAHRRQIIHRDVKPENILIDKFGQVKLTDFGLSRVLYGNDIHATRLTMTDMVMGTLDYIAPEQKDGLHQVDHRADVFAVGVVLYEMLTGTAPRGKFDAPSLIAHTPPALDAVVFKALSADPRHRFQSASDLKRALDEACRGAARAFAAAPAPPPRLPSDLTDVPERVGMRLRTVSTRVPPKEIRSFLWHMYGAVVLLTLFKPPAHEALPVVAGLGLVAVAILSSIGTRLFQPGPQPHPRYALRQEGYREWKNLLWLAYAGAVIWILFRNRHIDALPILLTSGALLTSALTICTRPLFRYAIPESVGATVVPGQALEARLWAQAPEADRPPGALGRLPGMRRLSRSRSDRWIAGVAGGMAAHLEISPAWTRLAWGMLALLTSGLAIVPYLIMALALPREDEFAPTSPLVVEPDQALPQPAHRHETAAPFSAAPVAAPAFAAAGTEMAAAAQLRPRRTRWANFALFWGILCLVVHLILVPAAVFTVRVESETRHGSYPPPTAQIIPVPPDHGAIVPPEMPAPEETPAPPHTGEVPPDWAPIQPLPPAQPFLHGQGGFAPHAQTHVRGFSPLFLAGPVLAAIMALFSGSVARHRIRRSKGRLTGWRSASFARSVGIFSLFLWGIVIGLFGPFRN